MNRADPNDTLVQHLIGLGYTSSQISSAQETLWNAVGSGEGGYDDEAQEQFRIYWRPGKANRGDYWTKHHPPSHHVEVRPEILTSYKTLMDFRTSQKGGLQGCVKFAAKQ
jgi:hypothetical protein